MKKEYQPYNDKVYCVELERNHTLWVMRNGKICWCGNCRSTLVPYIEIKDEDGNVIETGTRPAANADFDKEAQDAYNKTAREKGWTRRWEDLSDSTRKKYYYDAQKAYTARTGKSPYRQVSSSENFRDYFEKQPEKFKRSWLGETRYRLYSEGKLKLESIVKADTDYTVPVAELKKKYGDDGGSSGGPIGGNRPVNGGHSAGNGPSGGTLSGPKNIKDSQEKQPKNRRMEHGPNDPDPLYKDDVGYNNSSKSAADLTVPNDNKDRSAKALFDEYNRPQAEERAYLDTERDAVKKLKEQIDARGEELKAVKKELKSEPDERRQEQYLLDEATFKQRKADYVLRRDAFKARERVFKNEEKKSPAQKALDQYEEQNKKNVERLNNINAWYQRQIDEAGNIGDIEKRDEVIALLKKEQYNVKVRFAERSSKIAHSIIALIDDPNSNNRTALRNVPFNAVTKHNSLTNEEAEEAIRDGLDFSGRFLDSYGIDIAKNSDDLSIQGFYDGSDFDPNDQTIRIQRDTNIQEVRVHTVHELMHHADDIDIFLQDELRDFYRMITTERKGKIIHNDDGTVTFKPHVKEKRLNKTTGEYEEIFSRQNKLDPLILNKGGNYRKANITMPDDCYALRSYSGDKFELLQEMAERLSDDPIIIVTMYPDWYSGIMYCLQNARIKREIFRRRNQNGQN